ncbi:MAG: flagellar motor protein MotB [Phycisphaerae bacterium]|jgi:chemotaxis protein MotB
MARAKSSPPQDEQQGAPEWMVTFSDCMTLLLTFFVLLLTFSSFDERVFLKLKIIYSDAFPTIHSRMRASKEALQEIEQWHFTEDVDKGSEKATHEMGAEGALLEKYDFDYRKHKVFLIRSDEIFWANGTVISKQGREFLSVLAGFLKNVPEHIVISENILEQDDSELSMNRVWTVIEYLAKQGVDKDRFSISAGSTTGQKAFESFALGDGDNQPGRLMEIVLLQRSLTN